MNYSDAERIASIFNSAGYVPTENEADANIVIVLACSVRQKAIDRILGKAKGWNKRRRKEENFKTILSGCVLPEDKVKLSKSFDLIFKIDQIDELERFLNCHSVSCTESSKKSNKITVAAGMAGSTRDYLSITPKYESSFRAFVPIMTGCDNFCSYCAVPYTRGREKSRPPEEIIKEIKGLIKGGYKEITLLGQNVNSYGQSGLVIPTEAEESIQKDSVQISRQARNDNFVELLKEIDKISGEHWIYFYSNHPKDFSDELIRVLPKLKHFPPYIHLPLQSGNDEILRKMNRHYTAKDYLDLVAKIRKAMPEVTLTTDILVGFPGETKEAFEDTIKIVKGVGYGMIFIGQYSPRAGTPSAKIEETVTRAEKKERDRIITKILADQLQIENEKLVGKELAVLIDEKKGSTFFGRTAGYKVVEIKTDQSLNIGRFYEAKILKSSAWKLIGELII